MAVMRTEAQRAKADRLRELHRGEGVLVLPNAWDASSARVFEECGFPAVATTSAGIAYALGYPDGERLTRDEMTEATSRIASVVEVPVSADVEAGYGSSPEAAAETAGAVIEAGAVGLNLEDAADPIPPGSAASTGGALPLEALGARAGNFRTAQRAGGSRRACYVRTPPAGRAARERGLRASAGGHGPGSEDGPRAPGGGDLRRYRRRCNSLP